MERKVSRTPSNKKWYNMTAEVYKKIEKKIVNMKEREELWKSRYKDVAKEIKELVELNSRQIKAMEQSAEKMQSRMDVVEKMVKRNDERAAETFRLAEKGMAEISERMKGLLAKVDKNAGEMAGLKSEVTSQVNSIIAKHEKTFDGVIQKIVLAVSKMQEETVKEEGISGRVEAAKRFIENYRPPETPAARMMQPAVHEIQPRLSQPPVPNRASPMHDMQMLGEPPFSYGREAPAPSRMGRMPVMVDDDDLDMDDLDVMPGAQRTGDLSISVAAMNSSVSAITSKLATIEEKMAKMQTGRDPGNERIEDKIRMYSQSVADMQSRMQTVEKAIREGMTPMVESLNILTQTVKTLKEGSGDSRPSLAKPSPPSIRASQKEAAGKPHSQIRLQAKPAAKSNSVFKYRYKGLDKGT